ncbi:HAD family hydrolase [Thiothrix nivea]|uniref:HAD-superfamily hydrolase, subfamily IA, variant 1 n=1 Tax=Thiothrix nivea (strain ATCC 35100 / DSM 5205 / JP2) TaxID=870187 RepID=A0A656HEJ3_THINJ|nr:HAD-IA family hydrolase [Thiothrix nivea]EIJ33455.1 HAD-superfamily hydrolase, subfamily IA, variant 1 [Thiothrix nivea DSM 5205]
MKPYSILIFDWDGTLMDSEAHITQCMRNAIAIVGTEPRTDAEIRHIIGLGLEEAIQHLYPDKPRSLIRAIADEYRQEFLVRSKGGSELFAGARETLHALNAEGYYLAIATGKSRRGLDKVLDETGLGALFPITRCADETHSKPHPRMLEEILTDYDAAAHDALMVGDSEYDLLMARNIGMDSLAVSYGVHALDRLLQHQPRGHVDDVTHIPDWLTTQKDKK